MKKSRKFIVPAFSMDNGQQFGSLVKLASEYEISPLRVYTLTYGGSITSESEENIWMLLTDSFGNYFTHNMTTN